MAELLQANGYETVGVAANLYLRADFGSGARLRPVPHSAPCAAAGRREPLPAAHATFAAFSASWWTPRNSIALYTFGEDIDTATVFHALDQRAKPGASALRLRELHGRALSICACPRLINTSFPGKRVRTHAGRSAKREIEASDQPEPRTARRVYRAALRSRSTMAASRTIDAQIGKIVEWLKRDNAYDNTMIVVTSDHGETFRRQESRGPRQLALSESAARRAVDQVPDAARKGVESQPVSLIDVAPTAYAALNVHALPALQGVTLGEGAPANRVIFAETFQNPVTHSPDCPANGCATKVLVGWPLKYMNNMTNGKREFFDITTDPHEQHNLFATQRDRAATIARIWPNGRRRCPSNSRRQVLSPTMSDGLKGNQYIDK